MNITIFTHVYSKPKLSWYNWNIVESGVRHHNPNLNPIPTLPMYATLCDKICQWLAADRWFSMGTLVSSTNKTDFYDITKKCCWKWC
jgi:hypothetical protein